MTRTALRRLGLSVSTILVLAAPAWAQSPLFLSGDVFADVKRFSGDTTSLPLDGTALGAGARIGTRLALPWTVELGVDAGRFTTTLHDVPVALVALRRQT